MQTQAHPEAGAPGSRTADPAERRNERGVRACFEEACALVAPFFDPAGQWSNAPLNHLAMRVLRERFGHLSSSELMIMLGGIKKLHENRRKPTPASDT